MSSWQELVANVVAIVVLAGCVYYCFENGVSNEFTFDDHLAIEGNGDVDIYNQPFRHLWFSDIWGKDLLAHDSHRSYRPLLIVIFRYLYSFTHEAALFRVVSISAHFIVSIFVFFWTKTILNKECWTSTDSYLIACGTALLFATHPIHVEAVTAVVNLAEPLSALFIIIGYLVFHGMMSSKTQKNIGLSILLIIFWWINGIVATLLKETGILIALIPLVYILGQWTIKIISSLFLKSNDTQSDYLTIYFSSIWILNCSLFLYLYFATRSLLVNPQREIILQSPTELIRFVTVYLFQEKAGDSYLNASQLLRRAENPFAFITPLHKRIMSMLYLYFRYFYVMLWPQIQSPEYSFNCIPAIERWQENRFILTVITLSLIFLFGVFSCYRLMLNKRSVKHESWRGRNEHSALFEGMLWLIIPFLPLTGIVFTLGTLLAERLLYLCSVGFCFLVVYVAYSILVVSCSEFSLLKSSNMVRNIRRVLFIAIIGLVMYVYMIQTRSYNTVWRNDATLFLHAVKVCPESAKSNLQVSKLYSNQGYMTHAKFHLEQAKRVDPDFCDVHLQEAFILLGKDLGTPPEDMAVSHQMKKNAEMKDSEAMTIDITAPDIMNRIQDAILALARSIGCVFTNHQALRLLQQLWEVQLMATQSYPQILASSGSTTQPQTLSKEQLHNLQAKFRAQMLRKQALQASHIQLDYVAVTKYVEAANLYFDYLPSASEIQQGKNKRYYEQKSLFILTKAQGIIDKFFSSASEDNTNGLLSTEAMSLMHAVQCRVRFLAGGMRSTWMEHFRPTHALINSNNNDNSNDKKSKKKTKKNQANEKDKEQYKQYRWQAGALRIVQDLSQAITGHCASVISTSMVNKNNDSRKEGNVHRYDISVSLRDNAETMLEQVKLASMHAMKWLQELDPLLMDSQIIPTIANNNNNNNRYLTTEEEIVYGKSQLYPKESLANLTYRGVVLYNISEIMNLPVREQVVWDQWVELTTTYVKSLQWTLFLQVTSTDIISWYSKFLAQNAGKSSIAKAQKPSFESIPSHQLTSLLHGEARLALQLSVMHTFLLHRHYLHRRFHLAAEHGGLYLLLKLMPLISYTNKNTVHMINNKASAEEKSRQYLYAEWQARTVRLWHVSQLCDTLLLPAASSRTPTNSNDIIHDLLSTLTHVSAGISGDSDPKDIPKSGYFRQEGTSVSRDLGRTLLTLHSELLWGDSILPLEDILTSMTSNSLVNRFLSFVGITNGNNNANDEMNAEKKRKNNKKETKKMQENEFSSQKMQLSQVQLNEDITVNMWEIKKLFADPVFCTNLYWYADALAGIPGFYDSSMFSARIAQVLSLYRYCAIHQSVSFLPTAETDSPTTHNNNNNNDDNNNNINNKSKANKYKESQRFIRHFTPKKSNNNNNMPTMVFHRMENAIAAQLHPLLIDSYDFSSDHDAETPLPVPIEELRQQLKRMSRMTRILPTSVIDELRKKFVQLSCRLRYTNDDTLCDNVALP